MLQPATCNFSGDAFGAYSYDYKTVSGLSLVTLWNAVAFNFQPQRWQSYVNNNCMGLRIDESFCCMDG
jgi:hypothetical protein